MKPVKKLSDNKTPPSRITYFIVLAASIVISAIIIPTFIAQFLLTMH